jgi:hypothetical protein
MFACIVYLLNQYFKISNSRNTNDAKQPRDLVNPITSRFVQHNHFAICSKQSPCDFLSTITSRFAHIITSRFVQNIHLAICSSQSPRDLLKTITSRFAQNIHLLVSAHDKARQALDTHTTAVTAWILQCTHYIRQLKKHILSLRTSDLHASLFCTGEAGGLGIQQVATSVNLSVQRTLILNCHRESVFSITSEKFLAFLILA